MTAPEKIFQSLRASTWGEFVGQGKIKQALRVALSAAKKSGCALIGILF